MSIRFHLTFDIIFAQCVINCKKLRRPCEQVSYQIKDKILEVSTRFLISTSWRLFSAYDLRAASAAASADAAADAAGEAQAAQRWLRCLIVFVADMWRMCVSSKNCLLLCDYVNWVRSFTFLCLFISIRDVENNICLSRRRYVIARGHHCDDAPFKGFHEHFSCFHDPMLCVALEWICSPFQNTCIESAP